MPVEIIPQEDLPREPHPRIQPLRPGRAARAVEVGLLAHEPAHAPLDRGRHWIHAGPEQARDSPPGAGRQRGPLALRGRRDVVRRDGFAPAAVAVLQVEDEGDAAADHVGDGTLAARLGVRREGGDGEARAEDVVDAPAAPPGAVRLLLRGDEVDGALDGFLRAPDEVRGGTAVGGVGVADDHGAKLEHAARDVGGGWVDEVVHVVEGAAKPLASPVGAKRKSR